jgi:hypothetical protein
VANERADKSSGTGGDLEGGSRTCDVCRTPGESNSLFQAVMRSDTVALTELLSRGAQVNAANSAGLTPLMLATERDRPVAKRFLELHGPAYLCARFDDACVRCVTARPACGHIASAVRLQLLELELRHPKHRQATLRRLLSFSGGTVEDVSRMIDEHQEVDDAERRSSDRPTASSELRCRPLDTCADRCRSRLKGTDVSEGLHMIDTQELLDKLQALSGEPAISSTAPADAPTPEQEETRRRVTHTRAAAAPWFSGPASATSTLRRRNPTMAGICGGGAADRRADRSRVHQTRIAATLSRRPSTTPSPSQDRPHLSSSQIRKERVEGAAHLQSGLYQRPKPPRQTLTFARTPSYHLDEPRDGANSELSWVPPGASLREHCETVYRQSLMELQRERESVRNSLFSQVHSLTSDDRLWER